MSTAKHMSQIDAHDLEDGGHHHVDHATSNGVLGFWLYIMTDCILFATLFAAFVVLRNAAFGGPYLKSLIDLPYVFIESVFLLVSNLFYGLAILSMYKEKKKLLLNFLILTVIFGLGFLVMEVHEFIHLIREGYGWQHSAELTAFFSLVGTHGLHVSIGILWMLVMIVQVYRQGLSSAANRKLVYLGLFWNFLDIVWIFVFSIVYLMGVI